MYFIEADKVSKVWLVTYACFWWNYQPHKDKEEELRIKLGGNRIDYPGELLTKTADLKTKKWLFNRVMSTENGYFMTADMSKIIIQRANGSSKIQDKPRKVHTSINNWWIQFRTTCKECLHLHWYLRKNVWDTTGQVTHKWFFCKTTFKLWFSPNKTNLRTMEAQKTTNKMFTGCIKL